MSSSSRFVLNHFVLNLNLSWNQFKWTLIIPIVFKWPCISYIHFFSDTYTHVFSLNIILKSNRISKAKWKMCTEYPCYMPCHGYSHLFIFLDSTFALCYTKQNTIFILSGYTTFKNVCTKVLFACMIVVVHTVPRLEYQNKSNWILNCSCSNNKNSRSISKTGRYDGNMQSDDYCSFVSFDIS